MKGWNGFAAVKKYEAYFAQEFLGDQERESTVCSSRTIDTPIKLIKQLEIVISLLGDIHSSIYCADPEKKCCAEGPIGRNGLTYSSSNTLDETIDFLFSEADVFICEIKKRVNKIRA